MNRVSVAQFTPSLTDNPGREYFFAGDWGALALAWQDKDGRYQLRYNFYREPNWDDISQWGELVCNELCEAYGPAAAGVSAYIFQQSEVGWKKVSSEPPPL